MEASNGHTYTRDGACASTIAIYITTLLEIQNTRCRKTNSFEEPGYCDEGPCMIKQQSK